VTHKQQVAICPFGSLFLKRLSQICIQICTLTEKVIDHVDYVLKH
jgi:hypothetical protein